jgi:C-terminal processing protease CtpA/Prc
MPKQPNQNKIADIVHVTYPYIIKNKNAKIAVLINNYTASSGEMTTISFIGKSNVKLFGQASGGYTTANGAFVLPDSSYICLATSITADRNMKKYNGQIIPDVVIYDYMYNGDRSLEEAVKWLKEK